MVSWALAANRLIDFRVHFLVCPSTHRSSILQQVQSSSSNKLPANKSILVLGDYETGKTSLIAKMQGNEDPKKGSGLEFHYLLVRDEYRDEQTQLGAWVLDGDPSYQSLLRYALNERTFSDTTILLVCSMSAPWNILQSLRAWANVLEAHIRSLRMEPTILNGYRKQQLKRYLDYISPGDEIEGLVSSQIKQRLTDSDDLSNSNEDFTQEEILDKDVLTHNLGLDIVVVVTKTDFMSTLEKDFDYKEELFDFIQQAIRKFCLQYGASLFYVSAKINKNCDLLYKYLVHRIYGLPFKTPALVVEKDAVFIPAGWDNEKKIEILYENIQSFRPDDIYEDVIRPPPSRKPLQKDTEINCEEDQVFLLKMQSMLNQSNPSSQFKSSFETKRIPSTTASPSVDATNKTGEGVLQNFFNNLLNRKSGLNSPHSPSSTGRPSTGSSPQVTPSRTSNSGPSVSPSNPSITSPSADSPK